MSAIDFKSIKGLGRDCPHPGCGFVFEISTDAQLVRDESRKYTCEQCQSIIPWIEIKRLQDLLEEIRELAQSTTSFRILT